MGPELLLNKQYIDSIKDLGFGIGFMVLCFIVVIYVLKQQGDILKQAKEERTVFIAAVERLTSTIDTHNTNTTSTFKEVSEAHRFQREEHKEMSENLRGVGTNLLLVTKTLENVALIVSK